VVGVYSFVLAYIIGKAIDKTIGFRVAEDVEVAGIDQAEHAESAYDFSAVGAALSNALASSATSSESTDEDEAESASAGTKVEA
jgi:Amt family ammonium transporter